MRQTSVVHVCALKKRFTFLLQLRAKLANFNCKPTVNMDAWLGRSKRPATATATVAPDAGTGETSEKMNKETATKHRQYNEKYILYGCNCTSSDPPQPQCFFCGEVLSNNSMKPAHLQRHQSTKHAGNVGKTEDFFKRKMSEFKSSQTILKKATNVSSKALQLDEMTDVSGKAQLLAFVRYK